MKTRRVLREFTVKDGVFLYEGFGYGNLGGVRAYLPDNTKVELAVYEEVPPKRKLVAPDDMVWQRDMLDRKMSWCLSHHTMGIVGKVTQPLEANNDWHAVVFKEDGDHEHLLCESEFGAKQFIYRGLADDNIAGFYWKEPKLDWSRYECVTLWYKGLDSWVHFRTTSVMSIKHMRELFLEPFENFKKHYPKLLLEGRLLDGTTEIIDWWERPEGENGN